VIKRKFFIISALILSSFTLGLSEARACEPCLKEKSMQFEETARTSDLIIIGRRTDFSPDELRTGIGPETIKVKVVRVLKGKASRKEIKVKSWSGMCPYGVILNDNLQHVIFLKKLGALYYAVDMCSVKDYIIKDGMVEFEDQKIGIEDFQLKLEGLGLQDSRGSSFFSILYRIIIGGEERVC
jgi:hypothetical protein